MDKFCLTFAQWTTYTIRCHLEKFMRDTLMKRRTYVCRNCRYYLEHYIKSEQSLFTIDGHCINSEIRKKYPPAKFSLRETCECWEPMQIQIEERKQSICYVLKRMQENLEEIALILKDDADREI